MAADGRTPFKLLRVITICSIVHGASFPPSLRRTLPIALHRRITQMVTSCDSTSFNITLSMDQPFKGSLFTKEFSQECRAFGTMKNSVSINLPTSGCGVRLSTGGNRSVSRKLRYSVTLVLQLDRHLRQITDLERTAECLIDEQAFAVRSKSMEAAVQNDDKEHRSARMKDEGWSKEETGDVLLSEALNASTAWMEIVPIAEDERSLQVGEEALLMVKSTLPAGIGWKVVDCLAHDGLGDASQKLLDEDGCPVDDGLLPAPLKGPQRPIAMMRHQEAVAKFAAFKFPDRDRLHLSCGLQLCRSKCPMFDCDNATRMGRRLVQVGQSGEILDRLEVFNSVEVTAPGIELDERDPLDWMAGDPLRAAFGHIPGDRTFCVSADTMAVTFCVLGVIFVCAVLVAAGALCKARRSGVDVPYSTRSLFSTSSSGSPSGSAFGSKLLLPDASTTAQTMSLRGYGRIL